MDPEHERRGFRRVPNPIMDAHLGPTDKVHSVNAAGACRLRADRRQGALLRRTGQPTTTRCGPTRSSRRRRHSIPRPERAGHAAPGRAEQLPRGLRRRPAHLFKGKPWYVDSHDGGADNAQVFEAAGYRFLHIGLQFDAPDASLAWAAAVMRRHPGLPTIVSTHDYMSKEGERVANPMVDGHRVDPIHNTPQMVWDKLISKHEQVFLVLCGHQHGQSMRVDRNNAGHEVYQVLADYQDRGQTAIDAGVKAAYPVGIGDGWMRLMRFDFGADVATLEVRTIRPTTSATRANCPPTHSGTRRTSSRSWTTRRTLPWTTSASRRSPTSASASATRAERRPRRSRHAQARIEHLGEQLAHRAPSARRRPRRSARSRVARAPRPSRS